MSTPTPSFELDPFMIEPRPAGQPTTPYEAAPPTARMKLPSLPSSTPAVTFAQPAHVATAYQPPAGQAPITFKTPAPTSPPQPAVRPPAAYQPTAFTDPVTFGWSASPAPAVYQPPAPPTGLRVPSPPSPAPNAPVQNAPVAPPTASRAGIVHLTADATTNHISLDPLLLHLMKVGGSDLHLAAGSPPRVRIRGDLAAVPNTEVLTPSTIQDLIYAILNAKQQKAFEENLELDFAYSIPSQGRFRANVLKQRGSLGAVFRTIPWEIKSLDALNMPAILNTFSSLPRGLVLVTGPTGSGKSTTLAAIIDQANRNRSGHIMTIEDPIEFLHDHIGCIVNQREVGEDTRSFAEALKRVLRQDPDIILVGELRDLETISVALTAAETGHLVFATLHTQSAAETITRLVDVFPPGQQAQVRTQLAATLQAVICQDLCKTIDGNNRVAAVEIMVCDTGIRAMIRDGKLQQISGALETGSKNGSQTLNQHLTQLVLGGQISYDVALEKCTGKADLETLLDGKHGPERKYGDNQSLNAGLLGR